MYLLPALAMLFIVFFTGLAAEKLLKSPFSFTHAFMTGFLALLAAFHVLAYPMIRLDASFSLLFWMYTGVLLLFVLAGIWVLSQEACRTALLQQVKEHYAQFRRVPLLVLATAAAIGAFILFSVFLPFDNSDNSYYLPRAMEMLAQNRLGISHGFAWTGLEETSFPASVDASTLEAFKAYGSFLFGLHPTIFSRKALALVVQIVSFCTFYQAFCSITRHKHSVTAACVFFCVYILLIVPDIRKFSTVSFWVCRYPSQGKTLLSAIIYPALVFACAQIVECGREHIAWQKWAYLGLIFTAGIASTIVGVYWPFLCCLTMGLPYLLLERRKDFFKLLLPLFLVCLPVLVYAGLSYLTIATTPTEYFSYETPKWTDALAEGLNVWYLGILLPALVYTLMRGSKAAKLVVAGGCITLFLTFANPLLIGPVSRYLTTGNVYFRLFWMAPVYFLPAYAVAEIVGNRPVKRLKLSGAAVWLLSAALILSGGAGVVFARSTEVGRTITRGAVSLWNMLWDSPYNLSDPWEEAGSRMLEGLEEDERVRVVWLGEWDCFFRQYSERIELVGACRDRQWKYFDQPLEEGAVAPVVLHDDFFTEGNGQDFSDPVWAYEQLCASRVDYIGVRDDSAFARREEPPFGFEFFCESGGYVIYRIN